MSEFGMFAKDVNAKVTMETGKYGKIVKAKNWRNDEINPNGLARTYLLGGGCHFKTQGDWFKA